MDEIIRDKKDEQRKMLDNAFLENIQVPKAYENILFFQEKHQPFFYDKNNIFWFWNKTEFKWEMVDEVDIINAIGTALRVKGQITSPSLINKYLHSFRQIGRDNHPAEPPKNWIQFKDKIFDIETREMFEATPEYFFCNPISWNIGQNSETPQMDKLFTQWVGEEYKNTLYEIIAYSCLTDYPIHLIFCLIGAGRNGKSRFLALTTKFLGQDNVCATELDDLLDSRFESSKLYKKLVCIMGETNFGTLSKTSLLKKLTGQDLIGMEFKNKKPFEAYNYAKILISSNSLPTSTDTSEGFYRRWFIVEFPNNFEEGRDILQSIPDKEYNALAKKITEILPELIKSGKFSKIGSVEARKSHYIMASNPIPFFIRDFCDISPDGYIKSTELYIAYVQYLQALKKRIVKRKEFNESLTSEGFESDKTTKFGESGWYVLGLNLKLKWDEKLKLMTKETKRTTLTTYISNIEQITETGINVINVIEKPPQDNIVHIENNSEPQKTQELSTGKDSLETIENKSTPQQNRFADAFVAYVSTDRTWQDLIVFCTASGMTFDQAEDYLNNARTQGIIAEYKPGLFNLGL